MAVPKGEPLRVAFEVWDTTTNPWSYKSGVAANISVKYRLDNGTYQSYTGTISEPDATNAPGRYEIVLDANQMNADKIDIVPTCSVSGTMCERLTVHTDHGKFASLSTQLTTVQENTTNIGQQVWTYASRIINGLTDAAIDAFWHRNRATSNPPSGSYGYNLDVQISSRQPAGNVTVGGYATGQSPAEQVLATPANKLSTDATGRVTVASNADKTGYTLTSGEHTQIQSDVQAGMTAQGYTTARAPKLDNLNASVASRAAPGDAMTLTTTERSNIASAVWAFVLEASKTAAEFMRLMLAVLAGKRTVSGNTETYYALDDTTVRVVGTVDASGNRNVTNRNG